MIMDIITETSEKIHLSKAMTKYFIVVGALAIVGVEVVSTVWHGEPLWYSILAFVGKAALTYLLVVMIVHLRRNWPSPRTIASARASGWTKIDPDKE